MSHTSYVSLRNMFPGKASPKRKQNLSKVKAKKNKHKMRQNSKPEQKTNGQSISGDHETKHEQGRAN